ncbi:MAG TPA: iron-containing alcohol dehydrogenase [Sedimentisphaerales bacterium]|nr:iron-containing alcohol dehydrogenase [Sedimentisphaerales bacterium]
MKFEFSTARRIVFGPGAAEQTPRLVAGYGKRAFVVIGSKADRPAAVLDAIAGRGVAVTIFNVAGEPTTEMAQAAVVAAREAKADVVLAIGGGSVLDIGKVASAMLKNEGELPEYLEVVGKGEPLREPAAPLLAVPTTAGTGAEVTYNAVLGVPEQQVKVSIRSPLMLPRQAIVDPLLTHSMSPGLTASTGLDALTQLIEAFVSNKANPLTDGFCREGMRRAARSLRQAFEDGSNAQAREDMSLASLLGGLALANAKLGAVHGFAGPLGGMTSAPHGVICGRLLPFVMQANVQALRNRGENPDEETASTLARFDEIGRIVTGKDTADASDGVTWVGELCLALGLPGLRKHGLSTVDFPIVVERARKASSMQGNPVALNDEELAAILTQAIG